MKKFILLFSALLSAPIITKPTYGMEEEKGMEQLSNGLTVKSGREIRELVKKKEAHRIHTVEVPQKKSYFDYRFDVSDIGACVNLKRLVIRDTTSFYKPDEDVPFDWAEDRNAQVINEIAKICPPSLTELEIRRVPSILSGGASDKNLQTFANRAPGITHLTIDAFSHTSSVKVTDDAFVNFPHLKSLVLYDAKDFKGNKITPSIVKKLSFNEEYEKVLPTLGQVFDYHVSKGVSQLLDVNRKMVLDRSACYVVSGEFPKPDTDALIAGWELWTGKRWNGDASIKIKMNEIFDYHVSKGVPQLLNLPQEKREEIIKRATEMLGFYSKSEPSTTVLIKAWEEVMRKEWKRMGG